MIRIGFDLDKIFIDYPPLVPDGLIDHLYKKKANGTLLYRIPSRPEQFIRQLSHTPYFRPPIIPNIKFLKSLSKQKYELFLISSRFGFLQKQTLSLMKHLELDQIFDAMYFNFNNLQPHIFKDQVLKELQLDIYVDDDIHLLKYVAKGNKKTKLFWLHPSLSTTHLPETITQIVQLSDILA